MLKIYYYPKCDSCRKALKWLDAQSIHYTKIDISEKPPTRQELKKMLAYCDGELRRLFNTSGQLYRELKIKNRAYRHLRQRIFWQATECSSSDPSCS